MTMRQATGSSATGSGGGEYPVDNPTYNLLQAATSACEAVEAYRKYGKEGDQELFGQLAEEETRHAQQLLEALHRRLMGEAGASRQGGSSGSSGSSGGSGGHGAFSSGSGVGTGLGGSTGG